MRTSVLSTHRDRAFRSNVVTLPHSLKFLGIKGILSSACNLVDDLRESFAVSEIFSCRSLVQKLMTIRPYVWHAQRDGALVPHSGSGTIAKQCTRESIVVRHSFQVSEAIFFRPTVGLLRISVLFKSSCHLISVVSLPRFHAPLYWHPSISNDLVAGPEELSTAP